MFAGAINNNCRRFFRTHAEFFNDRVCAVGCSGNFTFEQLLTRYATPRKICSNDISLYTCIAGNWLTDVDFDVELVGDDFKWLEDRFRDPLDKVATIVLLLEFLKYDPDKGLYHQRMYEHYRNQWSYYLEATKENIAKARETLRVDEFWAEDVFAFYKRLDSPDTVFLSYMPTYKGGYERIYKKLNLVVRWTSPDYAVLDDERRGDIYKFLTARNFVIYDDRELDLPLVFVERRGGAGRDVFMYSNLPVPGGMVKKHRTIQQGKYKFLGPKDKITPKTRVVF